jgi:predicted RecA/RadA family phage recombinase
MKNFIQCGDSLTVTAPYAVSSGDGVKLGSLFGVAAVDALISTPVTIAREGVFEMDAAAGAIAAGGPVYWDDSAKTCTATATGNTRIGVATAAKGQSDTTVTVALTPPTVVQVQGAAVANVASDAAAAALATALNALLASLRSTGVIASS